MMRYYNGKQKVVPDTSWHHIEGVITDPVYDSTSLGVVYVHCVCHIEHYLYNLPVTSIR